MYLNSGKKISYLSYTHISFTENEKKDFKLDDAEQFFAYDNKQQLKDERGKAETSAIYLMSFKSCIFSDDKFTSNYTENTPLWQHWIDSKSVGLPSQISRYLFKLNIPEKLAKELYEKGDIASLRSHVVGKRLDTIYKDAEKNITFKEGTMQKVDSIKLEVNVNESAHLCRIC